MAVRDAEKQLSENDLRLIAEAIRRLDSSRAVRSFDTDAMTATLAKEIARGRRDLFSLVRAGQQALDGR